MLLRLPRASLSRPSLKLLEVCAAPHSEAPLWVDALRVCPQGKLGVVLPGSVLTLTEAYELRVYWFEIVECIRKFLLTGMPVWFDMGSTPQLVFGLGKAVDCNPVSLCKTGGRRKPLSISADTARNNPSVAPLCQLFFQ